jgi:uncharacterized protein (TIGR00369 family)
MEITAAYDGYACVLMDCSGKNNSCGVAHGGAIFALADEVFGIAANCSAAIRVAVSIPIQYISPATFSLVAVGYRVGDNGRYSTFRVMVYEEEWIIAEFGDVAIQVNTPPCEKIVCVNSFFFQKLNYPAYFLKGTVPGPISLLRL